MPSGLQESPLNWGETSSMSVLKGGKPFITPGAGRYTFKRQTALPWPGNLFLAGALPLCGLYHSATGGGLLADLLSMA